MNNYLFNKFLIRPFEKCVGTLYTGGALLFSFVFHAESGSTNKHQSGSNDV